MAGVGIQVKGVPVRRLINAQSALRNKLEIHRRIGIELVKWGQNNFKAGGLEEPWASLKSSTLYGRRKGGGLPLQDTGKLRRSFLTFRATDQEVVWGSSDPRALWHHEGTDPYTIRPKGKKALAFPSPEGTKLSSKTRGRMGRSKRRLANLNYIVVKEVHHPGLPSRRLLPSEAVARDLTRQVVEAYIKENTR